MLSDEPLLEEVSFDALSCVGYLASWLKSMQSDPKFIFSASAQASKAVDYILSFSQETAEALETVPF